MAQLKKCFVTGANGKIGKKLVIKLLEKNFRVVALIRQKSKLTYQHPHLEVIVADILDSRKYSKAINECHYIFHLAAYQDISDLNWDNFYKVNVAGTERLLECCLKTNIEKFIYLSTIMVFDLNNKGFINEESSKSNLTKTNYYIDSKLLALDIIKKYDPKINIITFYPTIVTDPTEILSESNKPTGAFKAFLWKSLGGGVPGGLMSLLGNKNRIINYILIDNLIKTIINCLKFKGQDKHFILGGENITVENYLRQVMKIKKRKQFPIRVPLALLKIINFSLGGRSFFVKGLINSASADMRVNSDKAIKLLHLEIGKLTQLKIMASN